MATSKKKKAVRRSRPGSHRVVPPRKPDGEAPIKVDNRILIIRRMRALGSSTEQIAATMGLPSAAVLSIEKC
jgi:hypothetical protein